MSATAENRLHAWLREQLHPCDYVRVETSMTGFPDANICYAGKTIWVELKVVTAGRVLLRKEQYAWACRRAVHRDPPYLVAWHEALNEIMVWKIHQFVKVIKYSRYLQVTSNPDWKGNRDKIGIKTILFPGVS